MLRDIVRAACAIAAMAAGGSIAVEVRWQLAAIDIAHRQAVAGHPVTAPALAPAPARPGRLRAVGRSALDLADAVWGVVR